MEIKNAIVTGAASGMGRISAKRLAADGVRVAAVDINEENLFSRYKIIREELEKYSPELMNKREIVALNKTDLLDQNEIGTKTRDFEKKFKEKFFKISILKKNNIKELLRELK